MQQYKIAIISDIHGNIWALDAVLKDIRKSNINKIINLGDCLYGPLAPAETADRLIEEGIVSVSGNHDKGIISYVGMNNTNPTAAYVMQSLSEKHMDWLRQMPDTRIYDEKIYMCHGTPSSNKIFLLEDKTPQGLVLRDKQEIMKSVDGIEQPIIACGHSHFGRTVYLQDGRIAINPGSVGLPAFTDDSPFDYKVESGCPHGRYAVLSIASDEWRIEHRVIQYDWNKAVQRASANNRPDWAEWLSSGRATL